jgi:hypothetical protein
MISDAMKHALKNLVENNSRASFTDLGGLQRDCMEVMCAWRREASLVDDDGEPRPLRQGPGDGSFQALCQSCECENDSSTVLKALLDFGAVSLDDHQRVVSQTPTFLIANINNGGRLATDGVLRQLEGYLRVLHRNVRSVSGCNKPRFERACTVPVAAELEPVFAQLVRSRGQEFVDSIDEWLERNAKLKSSAGQYLELGVGVYYINLG